MREYLEFLAEAARAGTPLEDTARRERSYPQEREFTLDLTHRLF